MSVCAALPALYFDLHDCKHELSNYKFVTLSPIVNIPGHCSFYLYFNSVFHLEQFGLGEMNFTIYNMKCFNNFMGQAEARKLIITYKPHTGGLEKLAPELPTLVGS